MAKNQKFNVNDYDEKPLKNLDLKEPLSAHELKVREVMTEKSEQRKQIDPYLSMLGELKSAAEKITLKSTVMKSKGGRVKS